MGSQFGKLKEAVKAKSVLASLVVTPAIVAGLALLGFQTYSLVTGKSFKDFDFDIGRLWESSEIEETNLLTTQTNMSYRVAVEEKLLEEAHVKSLINNSPIVIPKTKKKRATIIKSYEIEQETKSKLGAKLIEINNISTIDISTTKQNKQLRKYLSRLESEYLINPNMIPQKGKWYVGVSFSPSLNYRTFSYDAANIQGVAQDGKFRYTYGLTEQEKNRTDKAVTSYTVGVNVGRNISNRLSVFSGLFYSKYGEQVLVRLVDISNPNYSEANFLNKKPQYERFNLEEPSENIPYTNSYYYFEVPIGLSYECIQLAKTKISLDAGLSFQKLDNVNTLVYDFESDYYYWVNHKDQIFRKYGIGTMVGINFSQFVGERLEVFVNPNFKFNLNSTFKKPYPVNQNQYSSGLSVGLRQHLH